ncbi:MAG: pentapeptide repeat-containing protein [Desulfococcaceae bacterium]|jgi:uncharacterized protein YjbI with pentapeptide repeats|nr:pentapeptide repeat-containing protein [Desulfococcaceae bacterium]
MDIAGTARHRIYKELKTGLEISRENSIIFVVCPEPALADTLLSFLQKDLPNHRFFLLDIEKYKKNPADFFAESSEYPPETVRVFHIAEMENAAEEDVQDLLGVLQTFPEQAGAHSCRILLWGSPEFEDRLFFNAARVKHFFSETFDFTYLLPENEKKGPVFRKKMQIVPFQNIITWLEKVIAQFENWQAVRNRKEIFLIPAMQDADFHACYLPAYFTNRKGKIFLLEDLFRVFLENASVNFMTMIGEPGSGKTAFMLHYFILLARQFMEEPEKHRIPVFFSLTGLDGLLDMEELLIQEFEKNYGVRLSRIKLQDLLLKGKCFFLVDGFDEMISSPDFHITRNNLERIAKLSFKNIILEDGVEKTRPANKVLLTCRSHYFLMNIRESDVRNALYTPLYRDYAGKENYQIIRADPRKPDENLLKNYIVNSTGDGITARNMLNIISDPGNLNRLSSPPLLKEMLIRTAGECRNKKEVNIADIYRCFTAIWIERDDWRFRFTPAGRRFFVRQMALAVFNRGKGLFLPVSEAVFPPPDCIKEEFREDESLRLQDEIQFCEFIFTDTEGNLRFIHRSFLDYFLAELFVSEIRASAEKTLAYSHLEEEVRSFIKLILSSEKSDLRGLDLSGLDLENINLYQASLAGANLNKSRLEGAVLMHADLRDADLTTTNLLNGKLTRVCLRNADLSGANLSDARLREADLTDARFNGANLRGADLRGAKLKGARLAWADLGGADLSGADLSGAVLSDADLSGCDLRQANLNEADLSLANLSRCLLEGAQMISARFSNADLSRADLSGIDGKWAEFDNSNLTLANLEGANLREARLTRATLDDARCRQADFRMAALHGAKFRESDLRETDFSDADLSNARMNSAVLTWANLSGASLEGADLSDAKLNMSKLREACLKKTNFSNTDFTWADMSKTDLSEADLSGANLSEADLSEALLYKVKMDRADFRGASLRKADLRESRHGEALLENADLTDAML